MRAYIISSRASRVPRTLSPPNRVGRLRLGREIFFKTFFFFRNTTRRPCAERAHNASSPRRDHARILSIIFFWRLFAPHPFRNPYRNEDGRYLCSFRSRSFATDDHDPRVPRWKTCEVSHVHYSDRKRVCDTYT